MSDRSFDSTPSRDESKAVLGYASSASEPRAKWVFPIALVYLALLLVLLSCSLWATDSSVGGWFSAGAFTGLFLLSGLSLMLIPVRTLRRRPITRRSIWIPLIGSGFLIGVLVLGAGLTCAGYFAGDGTSWIGADVIVGGALLAWILWTAVLGAIAFGSGRERGVGAALHRLLIAGSVLELLVAVPTHVIVRRRDQCCASVLTGWGISLGVAVLIVSLGPGALFLYYRRWRRITGSGAVSSAQCATAGAPSSSTVAGKDSSKL